MTEQATIQEKSILIRVNRLWHPKISRNELYLITQGYWKMNPHKHNPDYAFSVYRAIIQDVYKINAWHKVDATRQPYRNEIERQIWETEGNTIANEMRWYFNGVYAPEKEHYIGQTVAHLFPAGASNPVRYVNC